ncbi:hypothetical protein EVB32_046 [Rhizobium phage RHph_TM39]|uniref:Uncharacterized protein n=1 Tax=Rhizobium phage RHph_TM30 TaxID=2509764 RepID=A0A7S5UXF4_9CAUD|nr:hypothetical protein PQC16_gp046 [Rhizobium phage RHph_TM30]QIG71153.1 hypothetical protein EVB93_046 [Rhizobium phage RHph_TM30]QIG77034.1 hypothetical protein EVB32_046 [Rhizobium phage RHph_TM39]QIG77633.1 hypothetical protein EVB64_046 [Rhizobium phage RHph_TM61]
MSSISFADMDRYEKMILNNLTVPDSERKDIWSEIARERLGKQDVSIEERRAIKLLYWQTAYGIEKKPPSEPWDTLDIKIKSLTLGSIACPSAWDIVDENGKKYYARYRGATLRVYEDPAHNEIFKIVVSDIPLDGMMPTIVMLNLTGMELVDGATVEI